MSSALELRLKIIEILCRHGGVASSSIITSELKKQYLGVYPQQVNYHINFLIEKGFLERKERGIYELNRPINYCLPFLRNPVFSLISGLGKRDSRDVTVVEVAIDRLREQNVFVTKAYVFVTRETYKSWGSHLDGLGEELNIDVEFIDLKDNTLYDIDLMNSELQRTIDIVLKHSVPIVDCTSLTKIYTIATYTLAIRHSLPLIYIYEQERKLVWIRDIETAKNEKLKELKTLLIAQKQDKKYNTWER